LVLYDGGSPLCPGSYCRLFWQGANSLMPNRHRKGTACRLPWLPAANTTMNTSIRRFLRPIEVA
jgi:hypothetical protein